MISFIIVDDEPLARESFADLCPWEERGYRLLGCAANGQEAQALIRQKHPDIVFTDVRMPVMDGLSLCKWIHQEKLDIRVVILTGYQDFEYVRVAMTHGAREYLLKSQIEEDTVLVLLKKLAEEIYRSQQTEAMRRDHYYQRIILGMDTEEPRHTPENGGWCLCMLLCLRSSYLLDYFGIKPGQPIRFGQELMNSLLPAEFPLELHQLMWVNNQSWGLLFRHKEKKNLRFSELEQELAVLWKRLRVYFRETWDQQILGLFEICVNTPSQVKKVLTEMQEFSSCGLFLRDTVFGSFQEFRSQYSISHRGQVNLREYMEQLEQGIGLGQESLVRETLMEMQRLYLSPKPDVSRFRCICDHLLELLEWQMSQRRLPDLREYVLSLQPQIGQLMMAQQIWHWLAEELIRLTCLQADAVGKSENRKIQLAIDYIHKNYAKNLTAQYVGEQVGLSKVYFSNLFKQETGFNFGDYLTTYRINMAKYLLIARDYKIYEIAEMIGYGSPQYFSQVFQKKTGTTPLLYKTYHDCAKQKQE